MQLSVCFTTGNSEENPEARLEVRQPWHIFQGTNWLQEKTLNNRGGCYRTSTAAEVSLGGQGVW